ncbi:hypothetical protein M405DRAFT_839202 [Rhizopogon salebrosus TDB-379]|nr:hypothetical protein M405DRAFT_839202 [Rhizopogon salebrosus TDB-379]
MAMTSRSTTWKATMGIWMQLRRKFTVNFPERRVLIILANIAIEEKVRGLVKSMVKKFGKLNVGILAAVTFTNTVVRYSAQKSNSKDVAVITRSGQGIGRSIAMRIAEDDYDSGSTTWKEIAANFLERRALIILQVANIGIEEKVKGLVESVVKEFGKLNVSLPRSLFVTMPRDAS